MPIIAQKCSIGTLNVKKTVQLRIPRAKIIERDNFRTFIFDQKWSKTNCQKKLKSPNFANILEKVQSSLKSRIENFHPRKKLRKVGHFQL